MHGGYIYQQFAVTKKSKKICNSTFMFSLCVTVFVLTKEEFTETFFLKVVQIEKNVKK